MKPIARLIDTALGRCEPDLVLKNAAVFNVFTGKSAIADVAVTGGYIAGVGDYSGPQEIDVSGRLLTPGFIDAHIHLESSMISPAQFARVVVPSGTTTVIADPHEIANVLGTEGLQYMLDVTEGLPLAVYFMLPSCVPATELEHAGARLNADDLAVFLQHPRVLGLGEMMDFPGLLAKRGDILAKIARFQAGRIDGHAPGLTGRELAAYIAAGVRSDHECTTAAAAKERLAQGMAIMLRQSSASKNLLDLLPAVTAHTLPQCMLATDDIHPEDLIELGHINHAVRLAIDAGTDMAWVLKMATINAAAYFGLTDIGAVAPGYRADLLVFDNMADWKPAMVFKDGRLVARDGAALFEAPCGQAAVRSSMCLGTPDRAKLRIPASSPVARVIGLLTGQLATAMLELPVPVAAGEYVADPARDILKLAVWERHHRTGCVGAGLLQGFGLKSGAIATTIAHDSHNLIVVGTNDDDMLLAVEETARIGGGIVLIQGGEVLKTMPLPIAGLMTDQDVYQVRQDLQDLRSIARSMGITADYDPFMALSFVSLPVIPAAKLTDMGLVDVNRSIIVPVAVTESAG